MTLTITLDKKDKIGSMKLFNFTIVDSDGSGGTLEMSSYLNHIHNAWVQDITTAIFVSAIWTDGDETITIGGEGSAADTYKVTVIGS